MQKASMTQERADLDDAVQRLVKARKFAEVYKPQEWFFQTRSVWSMCELEASLIAAETQMLAAVLLFMTSERVVDLMKAGLNMRSAWLLYERCERQHAGMVEVKAWGEGMN